MTTTHTLMALAATMATASSATISINFLRNSTTTPAANDGSEYGISSWTDFDASAGSPFSNVDGTGVDVAWNSSGTWGNGSANNVASGYIDNTSDMTISGLSAWLTSTGDASYTIQLVNANDSNNGFQNTEIYETSSAGTLLDTLTNANAREGTTTVSNEFTADILFLDNTTGSGGSRSGVAGMIITSVPVPEPSSSVLLGLASVGFLLRRRK